MPKYLHVNRKNKDALFRFIFGNEKHKEYALHLYNYLNHTEYENTDELKVVTLEDVMFLNYKNDVAVLLDSVLNLWEEQSTWNPNMPYRMFLYFASELEEYVRMTDQNAYGTKPIHIPVPRSYVFYNGKRRDAKITKLKLSDLFEKEAEGCCEYTVTVYNINSKETEKEEKCEELYEYTWVINRVNEGIKKKENIEKVIHRTIRQMPEGFILKPLLEAEKRRVVTMLLTEFDAKKYYEHTKREGYEEGIQIGKERGIEIGVEKKTEEMIQSMYQAGISIGKIAEIAKCSEEEVRDKLKIQKDF